MKRKCLLFVFLLLSKLMLGQTFTNIVIKDIGPQHYFMSSIDSINYTVHSVTCPTTISDIDGNLYNVLAIGDQCWMQQNLKTTRFNNGTIIPSGLSNAQWASTLSAACADYNNNSANALVYGKLYNWYAVIDSSGLCPVGWHPSTSSDWSRLAAYLEPTSDTMKYVITVSPNLGSQLKEPGFVHWLSPGITIPPVTNSSGFTALGAGIRHTTGLYMDLRYSARFWTSTILDSTYAYTSSMGNTSNGLSKAFLNYHNGCSVRCVKD